jgi:hypothetical protein
MSHLDIFRLAGTPALLRRPLVSGLPWVPRRTAPAH